MCPAPAYLVEEAADVLKQSGKEFLSAVPKDHKMFEATAQVLNHIYLVNASLKSLSPVNGMVQHVPISDFDCFDVGTPAPPAPSPPSLPHPAAQPWPSGLQKKRTATAAFGSAEQQEQQSEIVEPVDPEEQQEEEKDDGDGGDEGAGKKKRNSLKN